MFKIYLLIFTFTCALVHGYNYGANQAASYSLDQQPQSRNLKPIASSESKWNNGFNAQSEQQDGSYFIRQPQFRSSASILQRNPNFIRSESLRNNGPIGNALPNSGFIQTNNGDVVNERTNQRFLSPVSSTNGLLSKSVSLSNKNVQPELLQKTDNAATSTQIQAYSALPLPPLNRLNRPPPHSSSPAFYRHQSLEQILQHKSADKFLGPAFIQRQLFNQKSDDKFLTVHGKEEREINGTIEVKKNGLVNANLEEIKDGRFSVMDKQNHKVGDVSLHRDIEKHLKMTENNGITNIELEKNTNAELNVERDINLSPRMHHGSYSNSPNSNHKVRVHLEQNQQSRAQVEVSKNEIKPITKEPDNNHESHNHENRYRRDTDNKLFKF